MKAKSNNFVIIVNAFSRAASLRNCLESIKHANEDFKIPVVIILQLGFPEVSEVITYYSSDISLIKTIDGIGRTPLENINHNRLVAYEIGFNDFMADWVIAIEEDVLVSKDSLNFITFAVEKYRNDPFFRGVNLGSREPFDDSLFNTYSKLRYGMHGQASVIGKRTWNYIERKQVFKKFSKHGFDSLVELHLRSGFMVTPNLSRSLDTGWDGTHMPEKNDNYFTEIRASFVGKHSNPSEYIRRDINHRWRDDIEIYSLYRLPLVLILAKWNSLKHRIKCHLGSIS